MIPVFDGHNDLLMKMTYGGLTAEAIQDGHDQGHIDMPRARAGGFAGGFFALFIPTPGAKGFDLAAMQGGAYDLPLPPPVDQAHALDRALAGIGHLQDLIALGLAELCTNATEVEASLPRDPLTVVLHMEGAEAIGPDFSELDQLYDAGLRSLGPVWSRPTDFGYGVPFRYPSDADIGPGLTDLGKELIRQCNRRRIMVDLSHLNTAGLRDVAEISGAPLVATHSNAHAVTPISRNLTDEELGIIAQSNGVVGLNFGTGVLRPDGQMRRDCAPENLLCHLDHMIDILGEEGVALGSDFDGTMLPDWMQGCAGLAPLKEAMQSHGYGTELIEKLCWRNWVDVLRRTWGA
jgi:membrane dipeptidase